jgi:uncharacterized protein (DUF1684 family)
MTSTTDQITPTDEQALQQDWDAWHAAREATLATEHGWLSITAFAWLPQEPAGVDGLPGRWSVHEGFAVLTALAADGLTVAADGTPVDGTVRATVAEAGSLSWLRLGDAVVELVLRGGRYAVRVRDPKAVTRTAFTGVPAFPLDPAWVRTGRFTPLPEPRRVEVTTARDDLRQTATVVGEIVVDLPGVAEPQRFAAVGSPAGGLSVSFRDATNGVTTAPWRQLSVVGPDEDGQVVLDFNRTVNMPFAFTDFGTCPAPVAGNELSVAVEAGERTPVRPTAG